MKVLGGRNLINGAALLGALVPGQVLIGRV